MELLKMIVLIGLRLIGMTSVFIAAAYSPDAVQIYLSSAKTAAAEALPFCANFFSDMGRSVFEAVRYAGSIDWAVGSALMLTLLIVLMSLAGKRVKGRI
jgi:hypothetical protein